MRRWDEQIREKTRQERFTATPEAQLKLQQAMRTGAAKAAHKRPKPCFRRRAAAAGLAVAAAGMLWLAVQPHTDTWRGVPVPTSTEAVFALSAGESPAPITLPQTKLSLTTEETMLTAQAEFSNHTQDIWILRWEAQPLTEAQAVQEPTPLIWLETNVSFRDQASWRMNRLPESQQATVEWKCTAYRVTAKILHWLDEDWLRPGQAGYERQQSLLVDAYDAGALILYAGDWPDGKAGEIQLLMPDSCPQEDVLAYYVSIGALEEAFQRREVVADRAA